METKEDLAFKTGKNRMRLLKFLSSKQKSLSGQLSDARTQVSASTESVDAADILVASGHTPSRGSRSDVFASTQPVGVADTHILVITLLFFTTS